MYDRLFVVMQLYLIVKTRSVMGSSLRLSCAYNAAGIVPEERQDR